MTEKMKDSLRFVTRFYSPGVLRPDASFITEGLPFRKRHAVAASIIGATLVAAAAVASYVVLNKPQPQVEPIAPQTETTVTQPEETSKTGVVKDMKFEDATLPDVVKAIEKTYGVKVKGDTENQPHLTLSYRGTAEDLTAAINDLLGTNLSIETREK